MKSRLNGSTYSAINAMQIDMSEDIKNLKIISTRINKQLKQEQNIRNGLQEYVDAGIDGLKKTNQILNDLLKSKSLFGCNTCILFAIALFVIVILMMI